MDRTLPFQKHLSHWSENKHYVLDLWGNRQNQVGELLKKSYPQQHLALVYSTAEYCVPELCRSNHTPFIYRPINDALRMVTGCLRLTPTNSPPLLAEKKTADLRRIPDKIALASCTKEQNFLLHDRLHSWLIERQSYLKSFCARCAEAFARPLRARRNCKSITWPQMQQQMVRKFIPRAQNPLKKNTYSGPAWVKFNRLRIGIRISLLVSFIYPSDLWDNIIAEEV